MKLLCVIGEIGSGHEGITHIVDELNGSGSVYALCGWKSKAFWRVSFREASNVPCEQCRKLALAKDTLDGLLLNVPSDRYDILRAMVSGSRAIAVVVPAEMLPAERKKAIAELDSIAQALRNLG